MVSATISKACLIVFLFTGWQVQPEKAETQIAKIPFKIIAHAEVKVNSLSQPDIARIFSGEISYWPGTNLKIVPFHHPVDSRLRQSFTRQLKIKHWEGSKLPGRSGAPLEMPSDQTMLARVRSTPGAIGYVEASTPVGKGTKEISISN